MWKPTERNWDNIQFAKLRLKVDPKFNKTHDELSDCYYNYWKQGQSKPFQGHDVQATSEESKQLFDKLHKLIFLLRDVNFHQENQNQDEQGKIPEEQYNDIADDQGQVIGKKSDKFAQEIQRMENEEGITITIEDVQ